MNWLVKRILKIFLVLGIIVTLFVVTPLILLSKQTTPPLDHYVSQSESDFYDSLDADLTNLILDNNDDTLELTIDEAFINRIIQKKLSEDNRFYLNDEHTDDIAYGYMSFIGNHIGFKGVWTTLSDDQLIVTVGADYLNSSGSVLYQTGLDISFNIVLSENNQYYLEVNQINIGKISLSNRAAFKLANTLISALTEKSINEIIANNLTFGAFDQEALSFTVGETELATYLYDIDPTFSALLKVIYEEELLILDVSDEGFDVSLGIGAFRRLSTDVNEPVFISWGEEADKVLFMFNLAQNAAINFGMNPINPKIDLSEADVNSILDYTLQEDVQFDIPITFVVDDETIEYTFSSTNLFIRMDDDVLSIHLMMTLSKTGVVQTFDMQFNLTSNVSMNDQGDMVLTILDSNLGSVTLDTDILDILFSVFSDTLFVDDTIVIPKEQLNAMLEGSNLIINDMVVSDGDLSIYYGLDI